MIRQIKNALVSAFVPGGSGTDLYTQTNSVFTGVSSYLTGGGSSGTTTPFAFLNYIVFDNNFNPVASGHQRVSSVLNAKHLLTLNNINITQKGYVYIWVSNESNQNHNTYFDDLKVTHTKGPVLQEDHYYPGGATISALSSTAPLSKPNKFKYNGKEFQEEFDISWYDYGARNYDPQLNRFFNQDRFSEKYYDFSPYQYAANNPIRYIDVNGDSINVAQMLKYDTDNGTNHTQTLINDLNSQTGLTFKTVGGQLVYDTDGQGNAIIATDKDGNQLGSAEARGIMTGAISNKTTVFGRFNTAKTSQAPIGGAPIDINPDQVNKFIGGANNLDSRTMGFGMTFMHETLHSGVGMSARDDHSFGKTGAVVDRMNVVRSELNARVGIMDKGCLTLVCSFNQILQQAMFLLILVHYC